MLHDEESGWVPVIQQLGLQQATGHGELKIL